MCDSGWSWVDGYRPHNNFFTFYDRQLRSNLAVGQPDGGEDSPSTPPTPC